MATSFKVTAKSGLRVRSSPNGKILTAMPYGTVVSGDGKMQSGWHHIKYKGTWGWSYGQYLKKVATVKRTVAKLATKKKTEKKKDNSAAKKKKKTEEEKSRVKAKGTLGCWGTGLVFSVNDNKILAPKDIKVTQDSRWSNHNRLQKVPRSEFMGPDARQVTMTLQLSAEHGVKPRSMINTIEKAIRSGQVEYLVIGGKIIGSHKMSIKSCSEAWKTVFNKGELVRANVDVIFVEYA